MKKMVEVHQLSFDVYVGEILCVLGANGAGKSTTMNIMTGSLPYDSGQILIEGREIRRHQMSFKERLGVVPQELALYEYLTAEDNVRFFSSLYGLKGSKLIEASDYVLSFGGLSNRRKDKASSFTEGMKRRLNIACAIGHRPDILIMDEPTVIKRIVSFDSAGHQVGKRLSKC